MRNYQQYTLLNAKATTGIDTPAQIEDFRTAVFAFSTDGGGTANLTVKFQGSISDACPDFTAAQSRTNMWDFIEVIDYQDGVAIDGDTGITIVGADDYRQLEANVNGLKWICARVTARAAGNVTITVRGFSGD